MNSLEDENLSIDNEEKDDEFQESKLLRLSVGQVAKDLLDRYATDSKKKVAYWSISG